MLTNDIKVNGKRWARSVENERKLPLSTSANVTNVIISFPQMLNITNMISELTFQN